MIPKIIHYCWISGEENMPRDMKKCIESWHKYLPDYQFINWNDDNFDWDICDFAKYNRAHNNYAFCADYIRYWALYNYGGFYLDCDVLVTKSFDELTNMKRVITRESLFQDINNLEAAIMGCEKNDPAFEAIVNWYNNCNEKWTKNKYQLAPVVMKNVWDKNWKIVNINNIKSEDKNDGVISVLNCNKYFNANSDECFCQHQFKGSWTYNSVQNCLLNDQINIFLCAHKPIENYIPNNKKYIILDVSGTVKDDKHAVIDISKDIFTKDHNVCYGEGCAMRYLYNHPELLPEYVCFGHYRRMFLSFVDKESLMPRAIDKHGALIQNPFIHVSNKFNAYSDHAKDDIDCFINSIKEVAPEYNNALDQFLKDKYQYACNIFAMKREHFLEMCEMCFKVLDHFDKKMGYKNNADVRAKMIKNQKNGQFLRYGLEWQVRLQGFLLEYLTDIYYRYKFGIEKCLLGPVGIPMEAKDYFEDALITTNIIKEPHKDLQAKSNNYTIYVHTHGPVLDISLPNNYIYSSTKVLDEKQLLLTDDFCFNHNNSYGELNTMYYLWKNQDILTDYVGLSHYRRYFIDFLNNHKDIENIVDMHGAIIGNPHIHTSVANNKIAAYCHNKFDTEIISSIIETYFPEYFDCWNNVLYENYHISKNMFITKKETFIELCDFVFGVLFKYDEIMGFKNDTDLKKYIDNLNQQGIIPDDRKDRECRLQGYFAEWLTHCFWEYHFKNLYTTPIGLVRMDQKTQSSDKMIISLTSYPDRIKTCAKTLNSIAESSKNTNCCKVFVLSLEEFPNRTKDLPEETLKAINDGDFHIIWDEGNLKPLKKIIPTYKFFHDYPILVLDDDKIYDPGTIPMFDKDRHKYPKDSIVGISFFKYVLFNGKLKCIANNIADWRHPVFKPYQVLENGEKSASGCNGTIYPANCFNNDMFTNRKLAQLLCHRSDEDWCHVFLKLNNITQRICSNPYIRQKDNNGCNEKALWRTDGPHTYEKLMPRLIDIFDFKP